MKRGRRRTSIRKRRTKNRRNAHIKIKMEGVGEM